METENSKGRRGLALAVTVLFHLAVVLLLMSLYLRYNPIQDGADKEWPPADSSEILFGGDYVLAGDIPEPGHIDAPAPPQSPEAVEPQPAAPEPLATQQRPSPAQTAPAQTPTTRPDPQPATQQSDNDRRAQEIRNRVNFGNGSGQTGQPDGNATQGGQASGDVSAAGLGNRRVISLPKPDRSPLGTVTVTIKVNREGVVTSATYSGGSGAAAADAATRNRCVAAAKRARFSESPDAPPSQTGTLTYNFR